MMPSGHKAFIVNNVKDVELLLMHNKTYAAEYAPTGPILAILGGRMMASNDRGLT